jgi:hypothetical protein
MNDGNVNNDNKNNNNYVWPVRAGEWTPRTPDVPAPPRSVLFADLYRSWLRCRRMKRNTINAVKFEYRAELNLLTLAEELASGSYCPSRVIRFAVDRPKLREIVAADFRDRVVHHYLVERLERIYEPVFIHDSYACRVGKGVHAALGRVRDFMRKGTSNGRIPLYALHLDVKNFFMTIDKRILAGIIEDRLVKEARTPPTPAKGRGKNVSFSMREKVAEGLMRGTLPFLNHLTRIILAHEPMSLRIDKGDPRLLAGIPPHKSLLHAQHGIGLPVGNLTSQFFANVYLNELDHYCKQILKCRWYVRYCDDFLILDNDPQRLVEIREAVRGFLKVKLRLELNTRYAAITDVRNGIDFIGYIIRPDYVLVRRRSINNLRQRLERFERVCVTTSRVDHAPVLPSLPECGAPGMLYTIADKPRELTRLRGVVASYSGHFKWGDTNRLRRSYFVRYPWLNALYRLNDEGMPIVRRRKKKMN